MWNRFTQRAQRTVALAQQEAGKRNERYVNTEHLLLALLQEQDTQAAEALRRLGISAEELHNAIEPQLSHSDEPIEDAVSLTPRAKRAIDFAGNEAQQLGHSYIGTEHLLLGLIREREGLAGRTLAKRGVNLERARDAVEDIFGQEAYEDAASETLPPVETPVEVRYLLTALTQIQRDRLSGMPPAFYYFIGSGFVLLTLVSLSAFFDRGEWFLLWGVLYFSLFAWYLFRAPLRKEDKEVVRKLAACEDKHAIAGLIQAMQWHDRRLRRELRAALTRLLPTLQVSDAHLLSRSDRVALYALLTPQNARQQTDFVVAILAAIQQVGDSTAIPALERLLRVPASTAAETRVQERVRECLPFLEVRENYRRASRTLLRASSPADPLPDTLLRPAAQEAAVKPEELLRPTEAEPKR